MAKRAGPSSTKSKKTSPKTIAKSTKTSTKTTIEKRPIVAAPRVKRPARQREGTEPTRAPALDASVVSDLFRLDAILSEPAEVRWFRSGYPNGIEHATDADLRRARDIIGHVVAAIVVGSPDDWKRLLRVYDVLDGTATQDQRIARCLEIVRTTVDLWQAGERDLVGSLRQDLAHLDVRFARIADDVLRHGLDATRATSNVPKGGAGNMAPVRFAAQLCVRAGALGSERRSGES